MIAYSFEVYGIAQAAALYRIVIAGEDRRQRTKTGLKKAVEESGVPPLFQQQLMSEARYMIDGPYASAIAKWSAGYPRQPDYSEAKQIAYAHELHRGTVRQYNKRRDLGRKNNPLPPQEKINDLPLFRETGRAKK